MKNADMLYHYKYEYIYKKYIDCKQKQVHKEVSKYKGNGVKEINYYNNRYVRTTADISKQKSKNF